MLLVARLVRTATAVAVGILVVAIVMVLLGANQSNDVVKWFHDAGRWLAGPFKTLFSIHGHKLRIAVNWGIAAVVYGLVGGFLASLLARASAGTWGGRRATAL